MAATRPAAETTEANVDLALGFHRGAIDQTTITTQPPSKVMKQMTAILRDMGVQIQEESTFRYRCIRPKKSEDEATPATDSSSIQSSNAKGAADSTEVQPRGSGSERATQCECTLYGTASDDPADEVRFSLEVTKLSGLSGTYSLDIRRLKGNLKSYKYIYDTIRDRADLNR